MPYHPTPHGASYNDAPAYRVYTLYNDRVVRGAAVEDVVLKDGSTITALVVGDVGRGRKRGILPVIGIPGQIRHIEFLRVAGGKPWKHLPLRATQLQKAQQELEGHYIGSYATEATAPEDRDMDAMGAILVCRFAVAEGVRDDFEVTGDHAGTYLIAPQFYKVHPDDPSKILVDPFIDCMLMYPFSRERLELSDAEFKQHAQLPAFEDLDTALAQGQTAHGVAGVYGRSPQYILLQSANCPVRLHTMQDRRMQHDAFFMVTDDHEVMYMTNNERVRAEREGVSLMPKLADVRDVYFPLDGD